MFQSTQLEELLDAYGARNNSRWERFRSLTAAIKLFSYVSYELLHIQHSIPAYRLLDIGEDFEKHTVDAIAFTKSVLVEATHRLLEEARNLQLTVPAIDLPEEYYSEKLPSGRLPHDLGARKLEAVSQTISMLATSFLNLSAECTQSLPKESINPNVPLSDYISLLREDKMRSFELRFHNLQSLYDTYVSTTEAEGGDPGIPVLRGHISVVLHLLRTARDFAHYIERHAGPFRVHLPPGRQRLVEPEVLLNVMMNYSIHFVIQYLNSAENLCRLMLQHYTEKGSIEVPVPPYRGFHVRPSTLIANIVLHYGSDVTMELDGKTYDAKAPLHLFRANEEINAHKRRDIADEIVRMNLIPTDSPEEDPVSFIRNILMTLSEYNKLIIYEKPLQIHPVLSEKNTPLLKLVMDEIIRLQAAGKIDIFTDTKVKFIGDKRVLADIELLANHGYGEDLFGNNIPLPDGLEYLRFCR